uniref:Rho-GAP domain-containing protein n=2 Tax=Timema TaxID=61471 RepID=A0A7R9IFX3_9NEOP|nr:unnamed protein product [Timema tahoe]
MESISFFNSEDECVSNEKEEEMVEDVSAKLREYEVIGQTQRQDHFIKSCSMIQMDLKFADVPEKCTPITARDWAQTCNGDMVSNIINYLLPLAVVEPWANLKRCSGVPSAGKDRARPELCIDLNGAVLSHEDKLSSRKNVFRVNSALGIQVLLQCESTQLSEEWFHTIIAAIRKLKGGSRTSFIDRNKEENPHLRPMYPEEHLKKSTSAIGISKQGRDEPMFGCHLSDVCNHEDSHIPRFVRLCVEAIESKEENMKTDGLYRVSANLSQVQKIRLQVDQNNLSVLEQEEDAHVLCGALKLFFRELKTPLIPFDVFDAALKASAYTNQKDKIKHFKEIVKSLPTPNRHTLEFLLRHLLKVTQFHSFNRMHISNLAIVFGPTLMWSEEETSNMAFDLMMQNLVIECLLQEFDSIFK